MAFTKSLDSTAKISLGDGSDAGVSRIVFQVVDGGSMSTSAVVKGRLAGASLADSELISLPYTNRGTGSVVAAGTAITAEGIYEVDASGVEVVLDNTHTSGSGSVYVKPLVG